MKDQKKSAKALRDMLKGQGYDDATCQTMVTKAIEGGACFDDLKDVDKGEGDAEKTASALIKSLTDGGLDEDDARATVSKMIAKGKVTDDLGLTTSPSTDELDRLVDEFAKGGSIDDDPPGDLGLDDKDDSAIAKGLMEVIEIVPGLRAVIGGLGQSQSALVKGFNAAQARAAQRDVETRDLIKSLAGKVDALSERMGIRLPPITPTGARPERSPLDETDDPIAKGDKARDSLIGEYTSALTKGTVPAHLRDSYADAISRLTSGEDVEEVRTTIEALAG